MRFLTLLTVAGTLFTTLIQGETLLQAASDPSSFFVDTYGGDPTGIADSTQVRIFTLFDGGSRDFGSRYLMEAV